jgi:hypothetical protein
MHVNLDHDAPAQCPVARIPYRLDIKPRSLPVRNTAAPKHGFSGSIALALDSGFWKVSDDAVRDVIYVCIQTRYFRRAILRRARSQSG